MKNRTMAFALGLSLLLVALLGVTGTSLAYYTATGTATNVITTGAIRLQIHEQTASGEAFPSEGIKVRAGDEVSKEVTVENTCGHPFYLRIKLINGVESGDVPVDDVFELDINTADWTHRDDGYYYYNTVLEPGQTTEKLFSRVRMAFSYLLDEYAGKTLTLTVTAEAVQSENNPAEQPWLAVGWPGEGGSV